jgi:hypothetical protein
LTVFVYPTADLEPWPTLGPQVCAWIEENLVYGPGDLLGEPIRLDEETKGWIYKFYEVYPKDHKRAGQRRFQRCALSLPKGSAKTELAAVIAIAEAHPLAPVRFSGFAKNGELVDGHGVTDPYIPMIAYTEEQTEELAYGAARRILEECAIGADFDIGLERILRNDGHGKIEAVSATPNARDGARTTFQHADETHRLILDKHKRAWTVMLANLAKRPLADPWALETTTAPEPGAGSVAESTMLYAEGLSTNGTSSGLFYYHRQAADTHNMKTQRGRKAAIREARGKYKSAWSDIDRIAELFDEPDADLSYLERVWTNRLVASADRAFDAVRFRELRSDYEAPAGDMITLGFDGSRYEDATALVATHIETGHQWLVGLWQKESGRKDWEVQVSDVDAAVDAAFDTWTVWRMYADPPLWDSWIAQWAGRYGDKVVMEWWTNRRKPMAYAIRSYITAISAGEMSHDGQFESHIGNAWRKDTKLIDEQGSPLWVLRKERKDSPHKIDAAMAAILSWEARNDALSSGAAEQRDPGDFGITVGRG